MTNLLARYAECIFWMSRYMERAENLARIIGVHEAFGHDLLAGRDWYTIVRLNADEQPFSARYPAATPQNVINFYTLDAQNGNSIVSAVRAARENARTLRPWISTEMWSQLNVFYNRLLELRPKDVALPNVARLCAVIKEGCQTHAGITEGTFYRDEGWHYYLLGKYLERADQTTRLLDIEFHTLLPNPTDVGSPLDFVRWHAVLRSAAGYHAFRRVYPRGMTASSVAGFLLCNEGFPRSASLCVREMNALLTRLKTRYRMHGGNGALEKLDQIHAALDRPIDQVLQSGLHSYLDGLQVRLNDVSVELGRDFFGHGPAVAVSTQ